MRRFLLVTSIAVVLLVGMVGEAAAQDFVGGARPVGMGGAFTSIGTGVDGIYHNPAGIATARMYAFGGTYEYTPAGNILNGTIIDSKTNPRLAASAGYSYHIPHNKKTDPKGHDIRLALAVPALPNRVSVGLGGRYLVLKRDGAEFARGFTLDAGLLFQIVKTFHVGVTGQNLIDICQQPARCRGVAPLLVGVGASYGKTTPFRLASDFALDITSEKEDLNFEIDVGAEYLAGGSFPVRLGYRHRTFDQSNHLTGGIGWRQSRFGLDASADFNLNEPEDIYISASFSLYFN